MVRAPSTYIWMVHFFCSLRSTVVATLANIATLSNDIATLSNDIATLSNIATLSIDVATPRAKTTRWTWPFSGRSKTSPTTTVILANSSIIERPTTSSFSGLSSFGTMQHCKSLVAQFHVQVARSSSQHFLCETERSRGRESTGRDLQHNGHILPPSNRDCPTGYKIITSSSKLFGCYLQLGDLQTNASFPTSDWRFNQNDGQGQGQVIVWQV